MTGVRGPFVVTGTDTGVGKTVATAAIAAAATAAGLTVAVVKPGQTGIGPDSTEPPDIDVVRRLAAPATTRTLATFPDPLAPLAAARVSGAEPLRIAEVVAATFDLAATHDLVLVEGAGGLLVPMGSGGWTVADLAMALDAPMVVVARAGLGTLNHTALSLEACGRRRLRASVLIGAWPAEPELVHRTNLVDLPGELVGVVPDGAGQWAEQRFRAAAAGWLAPSLHGCFDPEAFRAEYAPPDPSGMHV
jgi:dethiobiotin synthetase